MMSDAAINVQKVSIIIPTFNAGALIARCLESVVCQPAGTTEIIVVDGASRDSTIQVVKGYASIHPQLRWVCEPDRGIYDAMNKGLALATGDWVYFLGADDVLHEADTLGKLKQYLVADVDLVYGDIVRVSRQRREGGVVDRDRLLVKNICHQAIIYRRRFVELVGLYNLDYPVYADWEYNIRCFAAGARTCYAPMVISDYAGDGFSSSRTDEVFLAARHALIARLWNVSLWSRVLRPCRYAFREEALAARSGHQYVLAATLYVRFAWHAIMAKLE